MKRVIELIRVSTEKQAADERASIPAQRAVNRRTASQYGLEIIRSIEIVDVSGAMILMSPEMQELLRLIVDPVIHGVIAREFSRIMRPENYADFAILQVFVDTRTLFYSQDGPIDFSSKYGRIVGTMQAVFAGNERLDFLEKVWNSKEEKRRKGEFPTGDICLPYGVGYDRKESRWFYTPEIERVREAFRLVLSGETSYMEISRRVSIEPKSLSYILHNPIYAGWRVIDKRCDPSAAAHRTRKDGRQMERPKIRREAEEVIRVRVFDEPLITESDFERVCAILETKRLRHWRPSETYVHRFTYSGFLTCAACGNLVYSKAHRRDYYICKGRKIEKNCQSRFMARERLERQLDSLFAERLTDERFLEVLAAGIEQPQEDPLRTERLSAEISHLEARRERVLAAYFDGVIDAGERNARLVKIERETSTARELLFADRPAPTTPALVDLFAPFFAWEFMNREDKRRLLSSVVPSIRVADYRIEGLYLLGLEGSHTSMTSLVTEQGLYLPLTCG